MQRVIPKVDVILLDLKATDKGFEEYITYTAEEKIDRISDAIIKTLETLKDRNGNRASLKLFLWREYGISEKDSKFCDIDISNKLKNKMLKITKMYPDACIIAGTVATKKHFDQFTIKDKEKVEHAYKNPLIQHLIQLEKKNDYKETKTDSTVEAHLNKVNTLNLEQGVTIVKNSCHVIYQSNTYKHGKLLPWFETREKGEFTTPDNIAFRPSRGTASPLFKIPHPETGEEISFITEICAEHPAGYANELMKRSIIDTRPDMHFVVSASALTNPDHICADYFIKADLIHKSKLITSGNNNKLDLTFYTVNVLKPVFSLERQLAETELYKLDLKKYIDTIIKEYSYKDPEPYSLLIRKHFIQLDIDLNKLDQTNNPQKTYTEVLEKLRETLIEDLRTETLRLEKLNNYSTISFFTDFKNRAISESACIQLQAIIKKIDEFAVASEKDKSYKKGM